VGLFAVFIKNVDELIGENHRPFGDPIPVDRQIMLANVRDQIFWMMHGGYSLTNVDFESIVLVEI